MWRPCVRACVVRPETILYSMSSIPTRVRVLVYIRHNPYYMPYPYTSLLVQLPYGTVRVHQFFKMPSVVARTYGTRTV